MRRPTEQHRWLLVFAVLAAGALAVLFMRRIVADPPAKSNSVLLTAPAGALPATMHTSIDGYDAAVLPTGRIITPIGTEVNVGAPKPYGLALSPDGRMLATTNNGTGPFSVTLISSISSGTPQTKLFSWTRHSRASHSPRMVPDFMHLRVRMGSSAWAIRRRGTFSR